MTLISFGYTLTESNLEATALLKVTLILKPFRQAVFVLCSRRRQSL